MADLINREALLDIIRNTGFSDNPDAMFEEIMEIIEEQPTAYDVEKVVAELLDDFSDINVAYNDCSRKEWLEKVVRKGGAE